MKYVEPDPNLGSQVLLKRLVMAVLGQHQLEIN